MTHVRTRILCALVVVAGLVGCILGGSPCFFLGWIGGAVAVGLLRSIR